MRRRAAGPRAGRGAVKPGPAPADRFFRHIVNSMRNGVITIHRNGTLALMNDEAYRIFSLPREPLDVGRPFSDVLGARPDIVRVLSGAFELSTLPNRAELRLKDIDRVIGYTLSQVKDDGGTPIGAAMFFKDLTQVEQLEERERLRDRLASLGEMAAGIAHELKNPLAGIEVMAGLLKRQLAESPDAQSVLADIIKEAKMANVIVQEVLAFVRPLRLQVEDIAVADVIRDAMTMAESHASLKGEVDVRIDLPEALRPIQGDPHQLRQIFTNLLTNAFEAMGGVGQVEITAIALDGDDDAGPTDHGTGPTIQITVRDNGPGIPPEVMDRIFSPFFTTKPQGSGLGLAIVRKIVDAHDGRIDVGERAGGGTVFRVWLPVRSQQQLFG